MRNSLAVVVLAACDPAPPLPAGHKQDSGFQLVLDSGQTGLVTDGDPCAPIVPDDATTVTLATTLSEPGDYLVCSRVPVTATADDTVLFLSAYSTAQLTGERVVVFAQAGASVNASGTDAVVVAAEDALVTVLSNEATVVRCPALVWPTAQAARACSDR